MRTGQVGRKEEGSLACLRLFCCLALEVGFLVNHHNIVASGQQLDQPSGARQRRATHEVHGPAGGPDPAVLLHPTQQGAWSRKAARRGSRSSPRPSW